MLEKVVLYGKYFAFGLGTIIVLVALNLSSTWAFQTYYEFVKYQAEVALAQCRKDGVPVLKADMITLDRCVLLKDLGPNVNVKITLN